MNPIDLESARSRWQAQGRKLGDHLQLDAERLTLLLSKRTATSLERRRLSLMSSMAWSGLCLGALVWFCIAVRDVPYQVMASVLGMFAFAALLQSLSELRALRALPGTLSPTEAMDLVCSLRLREVALVRAMLSCSVLLWWPFLLVIARSLGVDLLRRLDPSVTLVHVGLGLLVLLPIWWVLRWFERRRDEGDDLERSSSGGDALLEIAWQYRTLIQMGNSSETADLKPVSDQSLAFARQLQRRLQWGCVLCGTVLLLNGGHMVHRGGEWMVLTSGIVFQLSVVTWMVTTIMAAEQWRHLRQSEPILAVWKRRVPQLLRRRAEAVGLATQLAPLALANGLVSWLGTNMITSVLLLLAGLVIAWILGPSASDGTVRGFMRTRLAWLLSFGTVQTVEPE
ncbi:MAG: hypothetical protein IPK97_04725 [Ahniella sp.]|nr:hypothetical protein [Ahniella sp.]